MINRPKIIKRPAAPLNDVPRKPELYIPRGLKIYRAAKSQGDQLCGLRDLKVSSVEARGVELLEIWPCRSFVINFLSGSYIPRRGPDRAQKERERESERERAQVKRENLRHIITCFIFSNLDFPTHLRKEVP